MSMEPPSVKIPRSYLRAWTAVVNRFISLDDPRVSRSRTAVTASRPLHRMHPPPPSPLLPTQRHAQSRAVPPATPELRAAAPTLVVSVLRPRVPARRRLSAWTSTYAISRDARNAQVLAPSAREARRDAILRSVENSTLGTYSAGLLRFHEFCDAERVPEAARMPASDFVLSAFVAHHSGRVSKSCIDNWMAGLQLWHNIHDAPWLGSRGLAAATKSVKKHTPPSAMRARRSPVTAEHLSCLAGALDLLDPFDAAVFGAAVTAFRGCCRLGELVTPSAAFDPTRHVARSCAMKRGRTSAGVQFLTFHIPWSKTAGLTGAEVVLTATGDPACPIQALENHLRVNAGAPDGCPLFTWRAADGAWCPLTREWLLKRCAAIWSASGLAAVHGHSFRIGGATDLLLRGVQPAVVAVQGRWSSRAFLQYWRKVEHIIPDFINRAAPVISAQSVAAAVARFESDIV